MTNWDNNTEVPNLAVPLLKKKGKMVLAVNDGKYSEGSPLIWYAESEEEVNGVGRVLQRSNIALLSDTTCRSLCKWLEAWGGIETPKTLTWSAGSLHEEQPLEDTPEFIQCFCTKYTVFKAGEDVVVTLENMLCTADIAVAMHNTSDLASFIRKHI